jgi:hypothetical protein
MKSVLRPMLLGLGLLALVGCEPEAPPVAASEVLVSAPDNETFLLLEEDAAPIVEKVSATEYPFALRFISWRVVTPGETIIGKVRMDFGTLFAFNEGEEPQFYEEKVFDLSIEEFQTLSDLIERLGEVTFTDPDKVVASRWVELNWGDFKAQKTVEGKYYIWTESAEWTEIDLAKLQAALSKTQEQLDILLKAKPSAKFGGSE